MKNTLFVGNLPLGTDDDILFEMFSLAGTVTTALVEETSGVFRLRRGYVEMDTLDEMKKAIYMFNGLEIRGHKLIVREHFVRVEEVVEEVKEEQLPPLEWLWEEPKEDPRFSSPNPFIDQVLQCWDCGRNFVFTGQEQAYQYESRGHTDYPNRCPACHQARRFANGTTRRTETRADWQRGRNSNEWQW